MAKMFYTLAEAADRLGMAEADVKALIASNQLTEFRDGGQIKLKVEQVDLMAGVDADDSMIPLADSAGDLEPISLSSSNSGSMIPMTESGEQTGISIFDPEGDDAEVDPAAATQITQTSPGVHEMDFSTATSSGSGLANIALGADDTNLGADMLEDVYGGDAAASGAPAGGSGLGGSAALEAGGDLFESPVGETDLVAPGAVPAGLAMAEAYDGPGSGLVGGVAFGMTITLLLAAAVAVLSLTGAADALLSGFTMTYVLAVAGGGLGLMLIAGGVGWMLLRKG